ncbi:MAG TPA: 16S rRNA (guanine(527)-N(7))-methyltransferase RsmG [Thermoanaerobaculia bacterium]|nr:16S rRNA (guanine(527)-N(7))-methyltransferase RsmG [Thermoanaerobaculia bacterium]
MSRGAAAFPPEGFQKLLEAEALRAGVPLYEPALHALGRYLGELDSWRRRINLTGDLAPEDLCVHALESAAGASLIPHGARVLDIGSGGGFPGVPISIARPDLSVTLLEPRGKRASFLRHVVRTVPIENARVLAERVEDLVSQDYDAATCRAVGDLAEMIDGAPFLALSGLLLAWTTEPRQLAEALAPHFSLDQSELLPSADRRSIALFRKQNS